MPWIAPAIGAVATIGGAAISAGSKGSESSNNDQQIDQANRSLNAANMAWQMGNDMQTHPWQEVPYADTNQGWWNMAGAPPTTQIPDYQRFQFSKYGVAAPEYQNYSGPNVGYTGLANEDYTRLESALRTPGEIAAKNQYQIANRNLNDTAGGRGAYGSSMFTRAQNNDLQGNYMNTLANNAANAVGQRYGFQQTDLGRKLQADTTTFQGRMAENQAGNSQRYGAWGQLLGENNLMNNLNAQDNISANNYGLQQAVQQNQINQAPWQWEVTKAQGLWNGLLGQQQWNAGQRDSTWNNAMNMARMYDSSGASATGAGLDQRQQQLNAGNSLGGPLGSIGGSMLGQSSSNWGSMFNTPSGSQGVGLGWSSDPNLMAQAGFGTVSGG